MPQKSSPSPPPTKSLSKSSDKKLVESIVKDIERKNEKKPPRPQPTLPKEDVHNGKLKLLVYDNFLKYFCPFLSEPWSPFDVLSIFSVFLFAA